MEADFIMRREVPCDELQGLHQVIEKYGHLLPTDARLLLEEARMEFACYVLGLRQPVTKSLTAQENDDER